MTVPTWPVAPTTATESPESEMRVMRVLGAERTRRHHRCAGFDDSTRPVRAVTVRMPDA